MAVIGAVVCFQSCIRFGSMSRGAHARKAASGQATFGEDRHANLKIMPPSEVLFRCRSQISCWMVFCPSK